MKIQFNTDKNIEGHQRLETYFTGEMEKSLARFDDKITRIEVHIGDENSDKSGVNDKRCMIEARPANLQPMAVTAHADSVEKAFHLALDKIKKSLSTTFEKQKEH
ncbi:HPF/RaiA family ribosome-associated protein [Flavobacterium muglaense]|uniref:HPF/RaiA family ribosome-associated protein n=1 Tax=Flavobacterium muglaense TaxID=2764716 RepID=A0A923N069_9FLAO|nr:HPF/RaiA family ribosome-associated protein [Flavobacterium muglaense]MBC5838324.1 HPF/RaiA family ribosome-associated protein [Flavobacterium muglaense]MBC5844899.1 HPF/RaiA family ribosome-associated protein [Flavobacterium muglaense]